MQPNAYKTCRYNIFGPTSEEYYLWAMEYTDVYKYVSSLSTLRPAMRTNTFPLLSLHSFRFTELPSKDRMIASVINSIMLTNIDWTEKVIAYNQSDSEFFTFGFPRSFFWEINMNEEIAVIVPEDQCEEGVSGRYFVISTLTRSCCYSTQPICCHSYYAGRAPVFIL